VAENQQHGLAAGVRETIACAHDAHCLWIRQAVIPAHGEPPGVAVRNRLLKKDFLKTMACRGFTIFFLIRDPPLSGRAAGRAVNDLQAFIAQAFSEA
jgi:hypothetical protein